MLLLKPIGGCLFPFREPGKGKENSSPPLTFLSKVCDISLCDAGYYAHSKLILYPLNILFTFKICYLHKSSM